MPRKPPPPPIKVPDDVQQFLAKQRRIRDIQATTRANQGTRLRRGIAAGRARLT